MATEEILQSVSRDAGQDLSALQYRFVKLNGNGQAIIAVAAEDAIGVTQEKDTQGHSTTIGVYGVSRVIAGGAVGAGAKVEVGADGKAVVASAGVVVGQAFSSSSADGEMISVLLKA